MKNFFTLLLDISFLYLFATETNIDQFNSAQLQTITDYGKMPSKNSGDFLNEQFDKYLLESIVM